MLSTRRPPAESLRTFRNDRLIRASPADRAIVPRMQGRGKCLPVGKRVMMGERQRQRFFERYRAVRCANGLLLSQPFVRVTLLTWLLFCQLSVCGPGLGVALLLGLLR